MSSPALLDLEGLALSGFVREVELVDCSEGTPRRSRLRVRLTDGRLLESECTPYERVVRSYLVILRYVDFGRAIASGQVDEEQFRGIRFDTE